MIRIDEIYNNTFWPYINSRKPGTRMFFCDPPGRSDPDSLCNFGSDEIEEQDYVFFHDQEPVHLDIHSSLFKEVLGRTHDIKHRGKFPKKVGHCVVSEIGSMVEAASRIYHWQPHYYFYHGWACRDWFRGYDKTFLIPRAKDRAPKKTFMSPNRIVGGKRDHRILFLYNIFKSGLQHNYLSAPRICPYEGVDIATVAKKYDSTYPDIEQTFWSAELPRLFEGESTQEMTSCWLGNFSEAADSLLYVPTETVYFGRRLHLTEKTFKPIALEMPFVLIAPAGSLAYLRKYGFKTFDGIFDERYDTETDDIKRIEKVAQLLKTIDNLSPGDKNLLHKKCLPIVEHNYNHFFGGDFDKILWQELQEMLNEICN